RNALGEPAGADQRPAVHAQSVWDHRVGSDFTWSAFGSYTGRTREPEIAAAPSIVIERLRDGPVPSLLNPRTGTDATWSAGIRLMPPPFAMFERDHHAQIGAEISGGLADTRSGFTGTIGEFLNGLPARVSSYADNGLESRWHKNAVAVYASDRVALRPRVQLDAAIRFESVGGAAEGATNDVRWTNWFPRGSLRWEITDRAGV